MVQIFELKYRSMGHLNPYCDVLPIEINNKIEFDLMGFFGFFFTSLLPNSIVQQVRVSVAKLHIMSLNPAGALRIFTFPQKF